MRGFGVPLDYKKLSYLVLSTREEWEAAKQVAVYLHKFDTNKPIFSLKDESFTFNFGRCVANASPDMLKIWEEEEADAHCRIEGHWQAVLKKQEEARKLRAEIASLTRERDDTNQELVSKQSDLNEHERKKRDSEHYSWVKYDYWAHQNCKNQVDRFSATVNNLNSNISYKNSQLQTTLKAPPPVIQPLPKDKHRAMPIIFFLYMPPVCQTLSRFSFSAQQLLIPTPWDQVWSGVDGCEKSDITSLVTRQANSYGQLSLTHHYNVYQSSGYHNPSRSRKGSDFYLMLRSKRNGDSVPDRIGSSSVDHISDKNNGIWYPDQFE